MLLHSLTRHLHHHLHTILTTVRATVMDLLPLHHRLRSPSRPVIHDQTEASRTSSAGRAMPHT